MNTRIFHENNTIKVYICSANLKPVEIHNYKDNIFEIHYGHLSSFIKSVSENLSEALKYAANKNQENMLKAYIEHFNNGDVEKHKDS